MGICLDKNQEIFTLIVECAIDDCELLVKSGKIFFEKCDGLVFPTNPLLKLSPNYLCYETIKIQKECVKHVKTKGRLENGEIFVTKGIGSKYVAFAVCPSYVDGTLGENDYLALAYSSAISRLIELGSQHISLGLDLIYPKQKLVKFVLQVLKDQIKSKKLKKIFLFSNSDQTVIKT